MKYTHEGRKGDVISLMDLNTPTQKHYNILNGDNFMVKRYNGNKAVIIIGGKEVVVPRSKYNIEGNIHDINCIVDRSGIK